MASFCKFPDRFILFSGKKLWSPCAPDFSRCEDFPQRWLSFGRKKIYQSLFLIFPMGESLSRSWGPGFTFGLMVCLYLGLEVQGLSLVVIIHHGLLRGIHLPACLSAEGTLALFFILPLVVDPCFSYYAAHH